MTNKYETPEEAVKFEQENNCVYIDCYCYPGAAYTHLKHNKDGNLSVTEVSKLAKQYKYFGKGDLERDFPDYLLQCLPYIVYLFKKNNGEIK